MAQGAIKKTPAGGGKPARANKPQPAKTKKGARVCKAKKGTSADKLQRKLAAGIAGKTERLLGERAGHLELIGPGKKARGQNKDAAVKGGTRKDGGIGWLTGGLPAWNLEPASEEDGRRGWTIEDIRQRSGTEWLRSPLSIVSGQSEGLFPSVFLSGIPPTSWIARSHVSERCGRQLAILLANSVVLAAPYAYIHAPFIITTPLWQ
ncbi:hypothetical protein F4808DRAFT_459462 [Astrocystis sublimbata]|nr:hypothetical protein F4808DRAFT_459462 [Astrocystis sublimbata]